VIKQKDDVVYISDPSPDWAFWSPLRVGGDNGSLSIAISLQNEQAIALLLRKYNALGKEVLRSSSLPTMKAAFGAVIDCFGNKIKGAAASVYDIDITKHLPKTSAVARTLVRTQLPTGHMRLDLAQPLTQGNLILFKGERNLGKTRLAVNTIS
jgi:F0F1-type ATP synthase alpha subunit